MLQRVVESERIDMIKLTLDPDTETAVETFSTFPIVIGSFDEEGVQFVLPDDLELDFEGIELVLKNEAFKQTEKDKKITTGPAPLDESIDILNDMVIGLNSFLPEPM